MIILIILFRIIIPIKGKDIYLATLDINLQLLRGTALNMYLKLYNLTTDIYKCLDDNFFKIKLKTLLFSKAFFYSVKTRMTVQYFIILFVAFYMMNPVVFKCQYVKLKYFKKPQITGDCMDRLVPKSSDVK